AQNHCCGRQPVVGHRPGCSGGARPPGRTVHRRQLRQWLRPRPEHLRQLSASPV
ncbi:MAG: hypothetical protein AVDCRST_MAG58-1745, partial [uncultured Rubrobacteraceae bacterium]